MTTFKTEKMQLAIYLHASGRLKLLSTSQVRPGTVEFTFADPDRQGIEAELDYHNGAALSVQSVFASQRYIRQIMSAESEKKQTGASHEFTGRNLATVR